MRFFALLAVASAIMIQKDVAGDNSPVQHEKAKAVQKKAAPKKTKAKPAVARSYNKHSELVSSDFHVENDDVLEHPFSSLVQTFPEYDGWKEAAKPDAAANTCVNINKASGKEEPCDTVGNSAWNTYTSAKTASQTDALAAPYPLHQDHLDDEAAK